MKRFCPQGHDTFAVGRAVNRRCRACHREHCRSWRERNPEKVSAYDRGPGYVKRRERDLGRQRHAVQAQLANLQTETEALYRDLGLEV